MNFGLKEHLVTIWRHWVLVLTVITVSFLVAGIVAFTSSKVYVSSARILILGSSQLERATNSKVADPSITTSPQDQVQTQVHIARSPLLAEELALELGPQRVVDEMRWRWDWLRELPGKVKDRILLGLYGWESTAGLLQMIGLKKPLVGGDAGPPVAAARDKVADGLIVEAIDKADMFVIGFESPDPDFSAEVVNAISDIYVAHVVQLRSPPGTAAIAEKEATRLRTDLRAAEEELQRFSEQNSIFAIDRQKTLLLERLGRTQDELARARRDVLEADQKVEAIVARIASLPSDGNVQRTTRPNPVVDQLRQRLAELQTEAGRFVPGSATEARVRKEIRAIENQLKTLSQAVVGSETTGVNTLNEQLQQTLALQQAERQALQVRSGFIERELELARSELARLDGLEITHNELKRNVDTKETAYRFAVQELEEIAITDQLSEASLAQVVQVEPAIPVETAVAPRRMILLALGLVVGLMFGIALAYLLEFGRRTMATGREAEIALGGKTLSELRRPGILSKRENENALEHRRFATWLGAQFDDNASTAIGVFCARAAPNQGAVVASMYEALARQGKNVLLLTVRVDPEGALTIDPPATPEGDALRQGKASISGPPWLLPAAIEEMLDTRGKDYSYVLVDLPALGLFPELLQLADRFTKMTLLVTADRSRVADAREALAEIDLAGGETLGLIVDSCKARNSSWAFSWMALMRRLNAQRMTAVRVDET